MRLVRMLRKIIFFCLFVSILISDPHWMLFIFVMSLRKHPCLLFKMVMVEHNVNWNEQRKTLSKNKAIVTVLFFFHNFILYVNVQYAYWMWNINWAFPLWWWWRSTTFYTPFYIHHTKQFQLSAFRSLLHSISFGFEWKREETKAALFSTSVDLRFGRSSHTMPMRRSSVYCQKY